MGLAPQLLPGLRASTEEKVVEPEHPWSLSNLSLSTSSPQSSLITVLIISEGCIYLRPLQHVGNLRQVPHYLLHYGVPSTQQQLVDEDLD